MAPTFFTWTGSPPCLAIELVAHAIDVPLDRKEVDMLKGEHKSAEILKVNPLGKMPALKDNGLDLWESRAIITYLVNKYKPGHDLYPTEPGQRALIDKWLHFDNGTLDAGQRILYSTCYVDKLALGAKPEKEQPFKAALEVIDNHLAQSKFFVGDRLTLADLSVLGSLAYADAWAYDYSSYANVQRWKQDAIKALPFYDGLKKAMVDTITPFLVSMKAQIKQ